MIRKLRLSSLLLCFCLLAVEHSVVDAQASYGDPGYAYVLQAGLVQEINLSQTQEEITITLQRMYADENRVIVEYGVSVPLDRQLPFSSLKLEDTHGTAYELYPFGGGSGGGTDTMQWVSSMASFRVGEHWETIDGNFIVTVSVAEDMNFEFEVSIPVEPAVRVIWDTIVSAGGLDIHFLRSSATQSMTVITACYQLSTDQVWLPRANIRVLTESTRATSQATPETDDSGQPCVDLSTNLAFPFPNSDPLPIVLQIDELVLPRPHTMQNILELQSRAEDIGITLEIVDASNPLDVRYTLSDYNDDFALLFDDVLYEHIVGPWLFEIPGLP